MKGYHYYFLILKLAIVLQFILVFFKKESFNSRTYLVTEIIFKLSLGIFIEIFILHTTISDILFEDKVVISFAGGLLMYDAIIHDLPKLLKDYGYLSDNPVILM